MPAGTARAALRTALDSAVVSADLTQKRAELPPQYVPGEVEDRLYQSWDSRGLMHAEAKDASPEHPAFCIVIPPPNVTGSLLRQICTHDSRV